MPDITNYAYIWYNEAKPLPDIGFFNGRMTIQGQTICNIITSYSYPCYLAHKDVSSLSEPDKHQLLHDEIGFLIDRMNSHEMNQYLRGITLVQIPRVLYDLLSLVYFVEIRTSISVIDINCSSDLYNNYASYLQRIEQYLSRGDNNYKLRILQLNAFILNKIGYIVGGGEPPRSYNMKTDQPASTSQMEITDSLNTNVISFLSDRNKACESILEYILHADHIIYTHPRIHLNLTQGTKELFRQVLKFELQESSGYTTLYRGSVLENDSLIRRSARGGVKMLQSASFNTSILSGCIHDDTACTLFYMEPTSTHDRVAVLTNSGKNDKIRYSIKKFLKGDNSNEDSLFFIPPIHPLLQLNAKGELFHPRTKVNLGDIEKKKVGGLSCTNAFIRGCDYLHSNKTMIELDALCQRFKAIGIIDRWYENPEHQEQYERSRKAKEMSVQILTKRDEFGEFGGGTTQRRSRTLRSSNKRMKVKCSVDRLRGRGRRKRTYKRLIIR